jgi:hypothetical protein
MTPSIFVRLLDENQKGLCLQQAIRSLPSEQISSDIFIVNPKHFAKITGSPFIYSIQESTRNIFRILPAFENEERNLKQGLASADDFRFVRLWWEICPLCVVTGLLKTSKQSFLDQTFQEKKWVQFAKGGSFSPYYSDVHLVINWGKNGDELKKFEGAVIRNEDYYFNYGFTWPSRPLKRGAFSHIPNGVIFSHTGMMGFVPLKQHWIILSIMNSAAYIGLLHLLMPRGGKNTGATLKYEIGYVKLVPIPEISENLSSYEDHAISCWKNLASIESYNSLSHVFIKPELFFVQNMTINGCTKSWSDFVSIQIQKVISSQQKIDTNIFTLYNIDPQDKSNLISSITDISTLLSQEITSLSLTNSLLSYLLGSLFSRWDIRYATGEKQPPELPDPFAPLPACSPGMLQGEDGLPLSEAPPGYPLKIDDDGILVDDEYHPEDVITRLRELLTLLWGDKSDSIEREICEILGVKSLREYFRKPSAGGFWDSHVKRYSKSRRKAPIYWLLQSSKKNYALWIYYHRLTPDTLFRALERYVKPKIQMEESRLAEMQAEREKAGTGGASVKRLERAIDKQEAFVGELADFKEKLERAASLFLEPDLDDGVVLTIAPLHELVPWKEAASYWDELLEGKYEWSTIGKQLRKKGIVKE